MASTPLTDETKAKLEELGEVKYLVSGNIFHFLFLKQYKDAYPNAKTIGPEEIDAKLKDWKLDSVFSAKSPDTKYGFEEEIEHCYFSGWKNKETAFYHRASKTAIGADSLMNYPPTEQYSKSSESPKLSNWLLTPMHPYGWQLYWYIRLRQVDKTALTREAKTVAEWDFVRFITCHGDIIEANAKEAWKRAWRDYLH
ncbi:hypothetical protein TRAPUB_862 [Trametes pubescens]|uniref:Uncharacterized protein n=1 Tax=Trametes pubescens TaxID=154538 RepID=A0A1M2VL28_TRAPU|nr:hypothetical protein TRAPUB_862 [Trametes pubescens]